MSPPMSPPPHATRLGLPDSTLLQILTYLVLAWLPKWTGKTGSACELDLWGVISLTGATSARRSLLSCLVSSMIGPLEVPFGPLWEGG